MYKLDFGVGEVIQNLTKERNDTELLIRISGYDLFACEAQKHPSCHRDYLLDNLIMFTIFPPYQVCNFPMLKMYLLLIQDDSAGLLLRV